MYAKVLACMYAEVQKCGAATDNTHGFSAANEAQGQFLDAILSWGTTKAIIEFISMYKHQAKTDPSYRPRLESAEDSLQRRNVQTAAVYLSRAPQSNQENMTSGESIIPSLATRFEGSENSLFPVDQMLKFLTDSNRAEISTADSTQDSLNYSFRVESDVLHNALAMLNVMKGRQEEALQHYIYLGSINSARSIEDVESAAIRSVINKTAHPTEITKYLFVLHFIEKHHLHQCLLDVNFVPHSDTALLSLSRLVGLNHLGEFLVEHCVAPQQSYRSKTVTSRVASDKTEGERRGTLPLDLVAERLESNSTLLLWYLHLIFLRRPELYIRFPNTANPPESITNLHRKALRLYITHAEGNRNSAFALRGIEAYRVADAETPLLAFLKVRVSYCCMISLVYLRILTSLCLCTHILLFHNSVSSQNTALCCITIQTVLPLGGISPIEAVNLLEAERGKEGSDVGTFALELAYVKEQFGGDSEVEAKDILELYLRGTQCPMLAVSYAQRAVDYTSILWQILIESCLDNSVEGRSMASDGSLFGSLLEAAALSGADLAMLVNQIPPGMAVEGLRPRLVSAVADYRLKLQMHKSSSSIAQEENVELLRDLAHRSRRGIRSSWDGVASSQAATQVFVLPTVPDKSEINATVRKLRDCEHRDRYRLSISLPIR
jgi:vacuolar protein sorting-associated protein 41